LSRLFYPADIVRASSLLMRGHRLAPSASYASPADLMRKRPRRGQSPRPSTEGSTMFGPLPTGRGLGGLGRSARSDQLNQMRSGRKVSRRQRGIYALKRFRILRQPSGPKAPRPMAVPGRP
jgi:hypothetical protein